MNKNKHLYHIVDKSPWPMISSFSALIFVLGILNYMQRIEGGGYLIIMGFCLILFSMFLWWRDVIREGTYYGKHTLVVRRGLRMGFILFVLSEVMVFFGVFWAFFHSSLSPSVELGVVWPPVNLVVLNPWSLPLLNTVILLTSGATLTAVHYSLFFLTIFL